MKSQKQPKRSYKFELPKKIEEQLIRTGEWLPCHVQSANLIVYEQRMASEFLIVSRFGYWSHQDETSEHHYCGNTLDSLISHLKMRGDAFEFAESKEDVRRKYE